MTAVQSDTSDLARGPLLGVDYGTVRIGLALSDRDQKIAVPLLLYERRNQSLDEQFFAELIQSEQIVAVVVGLPVHLSGREGAKAIEVRKFGKWLGRVTGLPVVYYDERFSSVEAWNYLKEGGLKAARRRKQVDKVAAQVMLQAFLDTRTTRVADGGRLHEESASPKPGE